MMPAQSSGASGAEQWPALETSLGRLSTLAQSTDA